MNMRTPPAGMPQDVFDAMLEDVCGGLPADQRRQWEQHPDWSEDERLRLEVTVAAAELALLESNSAAPLPARLQQRVLEQAEEFFAGQPARHSQDQPATRPASSGKPGDLVERADRVAMTAEPRARRREWLAWCSAVAASLLAIGFGSGLLGPSRAPLELTLVVPGITVPPLSPAGQLERFLADAPADLVELEWAPVHDPDASGRVVWSDLRQEGYMVFENLDVNDPQIRQYQLWIFDTDKAQATPVDGGVFDVVEASAPGQPVVVPIRPHVPVERAVQFAVTVERPGGVTVSERQTIPVLASL